MRRHRSICGFMPVAFSLWLVSLVPAVSADASVRAALTYVTLMEVEAARPSGRLTEEAARRIAAAVASVELNRITSIFGAGASCAPAGGTSTSAAQGDPAVDLHGFVPASYGSLPPVYGHDFVRGTLVGITAAANAALAEPSRAAAAKDYAVGQYLRLVQDIALNQDGQSGIPLAIGAPREEILRSADRPLTKDGKPSDAMLRALGQTLLVVRAYHQTGRLPEVAASEKFERDYYGPLSAADKETVVKALRDGGVGRFVEALQAGSKPAAGMAGYAALWAAAHPTAASSFTLPDVAPPGGTDLVVFDAHPEWLLPRSRVADEARRAIDDLALAQQAGSLLRAAITRLQAAQAGIEDTVALARLKLSVDALTKAAGDGEVTLKQAVAARATADRQTAVLQAHAVFARGLKDAAIVSTDLGLDSSAESPAPDVMRCLDDPTTATLATERRLESITRIAAAMASDVAGDGLSAADLRLCRDVSAAAVLSVFKGGTVDVPMQCRTMVRVSRTALETYARTHVDRSDPTVEALLANLVTARSGGKR